MSRTRWQVNLVLATTALAWPSIASAQPDAGPPDAPPPDAAPPPDGPKAAAEADTELEGKLAPTYPELSTGGTAGLPWYTDGASLALPFRFGGDNSVANTSGELRYALPEHDAAIAIEKSNVVMLDGAAEASPVTASTALVAVRRIFGSNTKSRVRLEEDCHDLEELFQDAACASAVASDDRRYVVPYGDSYAVGLRVGAVTIDDKVGALAVAEGTAERTTPGGAAFVSLTVELIGDVKTPAQRHYGGAGARLTVGGRFGHFERVGAMAAVGARWWRVGEDDRFGVSAEVTVFGAWKNVRIGAGIVRNVNAKAAVAAGTAESAYVPTLWLSPQI